MRTPCRPVVYWGKCTCKGRKCNKSHTTLICTDITLRVKMFALWTSQTSKFFHVLWCYSVNITTVGAKQIYTDLKKGDISFFPEGLSFKISLKGSSLCNFICYSPRQCSFMEARGEEIFLWREFRFFFSQPWDGQTRSTVPFTLGTPQHAPCLPTAIRF